MTIFPINNDDYSVEEISYDDMMSILSARGQGNTNSQIELSEMAESAKAESSLQPADTAGEIDSRLKDKLLPRQDEIVRRIAENANRQLPDWLLNH